MVILIFVSSVLNEDSVDCLSNSTEMIAAGVGHLDVKSCPSSCLSANPSLNLLATPVITASVVCLRFLKGDSQHFDCLSLCGKSSKSVLTVHSATFSDCEVRLHCRKSFFANIRCEFSQIEGGVILCLL